MKNLMKYGVLTMGLLAVLATRCTSVSLTTAMVPGTWQTTSPAMISPVSRDADSDPSEGAGQVPRIAADELMKLMEGDTNVLIVDNRFKADFKEEHIRGAINFPWKSRIWRPAGLPQDRLLIFYCDCGSEESSVDIATQLVENWGYKRGNIRVLMGGWSQWKGLGYSTEKGS